MPKTIFTGAYADLVALLKAARQDAGLTQVQLAERIGKDQSYVSLVEQSQRRVDVIEFIAICRALDADPAAVFGTLLEQVLTKTEN